jgi:murein DD-endopeptidase MepM/ murein hydrolase activator NlpD
MIFPKLKGEAFGYVNLNLEAEVWAKGGAVPDGKHVADADVSTKMVDDLHKKYSVDFSYGGWMEDRSFLWKGTYLEPLNTYIHLGVDINAPADTEIAADFDCDVVKIDDDYPEEGGWGPRVIVKHAQKPVYLIYAHLDRNILCKVGDKLASGQIFASIGKPPYNGNWFPHVHVQVIREEYYKELAEKDLWDDLDGYGSVKEIEELAYRFPDPLQYISLI